MTDEAMTNDEKTREDIAKAGFLMLLFATPILIIFALLGRIEQGFGAWGCLTTVLFLAWYRWDLRKHPSFWIAIAILCLIQIPIVVYVPWNAKGLNGRAVMPLAFADGGVGMGLLKLTELAIKKKEHREVG